MSKTEQIRLKNDTFRISFSGCRIVMTRTVASSKNLMTILKAVRDFSNFNELNDPYQEHDYGNFEVDNKKYFWKFDYYDDEFKHFKEDGNRVLTIGGIEDY